MLDDVPHPRLTKSELEDLADFRFTIRRYLRTSEGFIRQIGITSQQYMLMLAIVGDPDRDWATIQQIAERVHLRHHSAVELVDRAQSRGLVGRSRDPDDRRVVRVSLTEEGRTLLDALGAQHLAELRRLRPMLLPLLSGSRLL